MIWAQLIWGLVLAGLLGFTFRRAWRRALGSVELEHIAGLRTPVADGARITFWFSGGRFATLTDRVLIVNGVHSSTGTADCYLVKGPVYWDAIFDALDGT